MKSIQAGLILVMTAVGSVCAANAQEYDLAIMNGRVMDPETQYDAVANVGINGGRIVVITEKKIDGKETIDARGLVVAPGFIDTHFHWTRPIGYKLALRDGVTTAMDLEAGAYGPRVDEWYRMHSGRSQVNYGTASGHEFARTKVMQSLPDEDLLDAPYSVVKGRASGTAWFEKVATLSKRGTACSPLSTRVSDKEHWVSHPPWATSRAQRRARCSRSSESAPTTAGPPPFICATRPAP